MNKQVKNLLLTGSLIGSITMLPFTTLAADLTTDLTVALSPEKTTDKKAPTSQQTAKATKTAKSVEKSLSILSTKAANKKGAVEHAAKTTTGKSLANVTAKTQSNTNNALDHDTWIHSIDITLDNDRNGNGYYSHITVDFDADTHYDHTTVYATLSLTDPNGITTEYFTTNDFDLYGDSGDDKHQVETLLTTHWVTDYYDLSIALFDAHSGALVAYVDYHDAPQLDYLALESLDYEESYSQLLSTFSSRLFLQHDDDGDGYYHAFNIDLDIDANFGSADVYAELYVSTDEYSWLPLFTSGHFVVNEDFTTDMQSWEFEWISGYPTSHYSIKAVIVDADSHQTLLEVLPGDNPAFAAIPLEDVSFEVSPPVVVTSTNTNSSNTTTSTSTNKTTVSKESSGGGMGGLMLLLLMGFAGVRRI